MSHLHQIRNPCRRDLDTRTVVCACKSFGLFLNIETGYGDPALEELVITLFNDIRKGIICFLVRLVTCPNSEEETFSLRIEGSQKLRNCAMMVIVRSAVTHSQEIGF